MSHLCSSWLKRLAIVSSLLLPLTGSVAHAETFTFYHDQILGTSLEIQVEAEQASEATAAETRILKEIERLSNVFSTYDANSEFSRWQKDAKQPTKIASELFTMLEASEKWNAQSGGAFQPGAEAISRIWKNGEKQNQLPSPEALNAVVATAQQKHWKLDAEAKTATRLSDCPLTLNAVAKGAIVEWASKAGMESGSVQGLIVNLGGDLRVCGSAVQQVRITDPRSDAVNAETIETIFVADRAVATSGNYRRGFQIGEKWFSHIIDPRTGKPAGHIASATVVAASSADADALATICNVLSVAESMALVESMDNAECFLVTTDGQQHRSRGWHELASPRLFRFVSSPALLAQAEGDKDAAKAKPELLELEVKFELDRPKGGQYRRPYVAVWIEDKDEFPVRTALLFMTTKSPGPRWHRDLLRWYRNDAERKLADGTDLIGTIAGATRNPGEYKALFDGLDDAGKPLKPGKYTLFIEVAREHGTYQLIRHPLTLGQDPIAETKLKTNVEVKSASFEYRARAAQAPEKAAQ